MQKRESHTLTSFIHFIKEKEQKKNFAIFSLLSLGVYLVMMILYPTLFISGDSYYYLFGAAKGYNVFRPMGYSHFLQYLHTISPYSNLILITQYWIHILCSLLFIFTINYFFPSKSNFQLIAFYSFSILVIFSPSLLYMCNLLNSDSLFISLTLAYITSLIWFIANRSILMICINFLLCYLTFQLRYAGWFYPIVTSIIILMYLRGYLKLIFIIPIAILFLLINNKTKETYKRYHVKTVSGFNGWQLANNAMHMLPYIDLAPESFKDENLVTLHRMTKTIDNSKYKKLGLTFDYMWNNDYPLKQFCFRKMHKEYIYFFDSWTKCGIIFNDYGKILIIKYPFEYLKHFILPNFISVFYKTNCEVLTTNTILNADNYWFKDTEYRSPLFDPYHTYLFPLMPIFVSILWVFYLGCTCYLHLNKMKNKLSNLQRQVIQFIQFFIVVFVVFYVIAAPITLRFLLGANALQLLILYIASTHYLAFNNKKK